MVKVKICGITSLEDAQAAVVAGADALGFVFFQQSPRCLAPVQAAAIITALPPFVQTVGLFVNASLEFVNATAQQCGLDLVQLHGDESPAFCRQVQRRVIKAFRVRDLGSLARLGDYRVAGYLLDAWSATAYGGTGATFDWGLAAEAQRHGPVILAGGLTPENVADGIRAVRPYGVDVSSGVESAPGKKDSLLLQRFIQQAKGQADHART